jgi:alkylresorcinol/alkylpyrone synthase
MKLTDGGLRLVLASDLPRVIGTLLPATVKEFLAAEGLNVEDVSFWVAHQGGPKVLDAIGEGLDLRADTLRPSWDVWERYGNVSSASVFFILRALQESAPPAPGALGVMLAFGPGLSCEMALLRAGGWLSENGR